MSANNFVITSHYFHNDIAISCAFHFHYPRKQLYFCCASIQVVAAFVLSASTLTLSFLPLIVIIVSSLSLLPPLCGTFAFVLQPIRFAICQCQMHVKIKKKLNFFNSQRFPIFCAFNTNMLCSVFGACQPFLSNDFLRVLFFIFFFVFDSRQMSYPVARSPSCIYVVDIASHRYEQFYSTHKYIRTKRVLCVSLYTHPTNFHFPRIDISLRF